MLNIVDNKRISKKVIILEISLHKSDRDTFYVLLLSLKPVWKVLFDITPYLEKNQPKTQEALIFSILPNK